MLYFISLIFFTHVVYSYDKIHHKMTDQEAQALFGTSVKDIPDYQMVAISHGPCKNNSVNRILHIKSIQLDIDLYLSPTEGYLASEDLPIWEARGDRSSPTGIKYIKKIDERRKRSKRFYQDPLHLAAFTCTRDARGEMIFEGTIGDDLVVRPPPDRLRKKFSRLKRDFPQSSRRSDYRSDLRYTYYHVVYKNKEKPSLSDGLRDKIISRRDNEKRPQIRRKRSDDNDEDYPMELPKTIHPQILVILDYDMYQALKTVDLIKEYVLNFWNAVDLRYRALTNPEVRLNIAGIIYASDPYGTPYIQNHRTRPKDGPILNVDQVLDDMASYFYNETIDKSLQRFVLERDFDLAVAMTKLNLCNLDPKDREFDCKTLGLAFHGGACTVNIDSKLLESIAIVEDNSGYIGIVPAAHEVAHLLGVPHDGDGDVESTRCNAYDGYIMTGMFTLTENVFTWSSCSMKYFAKFFRSPAAECLFDKPEKRKQGYRVLPGRTMTLDEQCDRIQGTYACNKDASACTALKCYDSSSGGRCHPIAPAAEGSPCGEEKYCINGKCLFLNTTEVVIEYAPEPTEPNFWDYRPIEVKRL